MPFTMFIFLFGEGEGGRSEGSQEDGDRSLAVDLARCASLGNGEMVCGVVCAVSIC